MKQPSKEIILTHDLSLYLGKGMFVWRVSVLSVKNKQMKFYA